MDNNINLSRNDRIIMDVIWDNGEMSNSDILQQLDNNRNWSRHIVKTYVKRLIDKGLVGIKVISSRKHRYYPLISKEEFLANDTSYYIKNNYDGLSYMIAGLIKEEKVSQDEIEKIRSLLKEYRGK